MRLFAFEFVILPAIIFFQQSSIGYPLEAILTCYRILDDPYVAEMETRNAYVANISRATGISNGLKPDSSSIHSRCRTTIRQTIEQMRLLPNVSLIEQLAGPFPLELKLRKENRFRLESDWLNLFVELLGNDSRTSELPMPPWPKLVERLSHLQSENPDDLTIAIATAVARLRQGSAKAKQRVLQLLFLSWLMN
jgi:hypothetical protein